MRERLRQQEIKVPSNKIDLLKNELENLQTSHWAHDLSPFIWKFSGKLELGTWRN